MIKNYTQVLILLAMFSTSATFAQDYITSIKDHLTSTRSAAEFSANDIEDFKISNEVLTRHNNVTHVYALQRINGIPVKNAIVNAAFKEGNIVYLSETLESRLAERVNTSTPVINPIQAASAASSQLGLGNSNFEVQTAISTQEYVLNTGNVSLDNVPVSLVYATTEEGVLRLAWDLSIHTTNGKNWWSVRIDAVSGELLDKNDWVVSCTFESHGHNTRSQIATKKSFSLEKNDETPSEILAGEQYNVYGLPLESPNHGDASLIVEPQNLTASPFGWHDTDGAEGAEFTITRGNNVWAQEDQNGNNGVGFAPDGGEALNFDFEYNFDTNPANMVEAATTNLFYWNNVIHDIMYQYGFDEVSGNFQENNYNEEGLGNDFVFADSQDGSGLNNATFGTPPDGQNPVMTMFLWSPSGEPGESVTVNNGPLAGGYLGVGATFGAILPEDEPITSDLVLLNDGVDDEEDGCEEITNGDEMEGKIVVIRRGTCEFGVKVLGAENEGAIAVIVVNSDATPDPIAMGAGAVGDQVTIPSVMVGQADGEAIIAALLNGDTVNVSLLNAGPFQIDGDVDNGIIVHEYGHGISNRLTGGPALAGCLNTSQQEEQMGEGWSDYFGMMLTMREGDTAEQGRGVGTYAIGQPITGGGIRPAPYSTDMDINGLTYGDTNNTATISQPHGIGTVWATILWDMTWEFIDQYGFDDDLYAGTGGNNIAMQLVIDGLKLQPCLPGFVDGRNAIIAAVDLNNAFDTDQERRDAKCVVYTAFASRGVGFSADQGSPFSRIDQVEAFDFPEGNDNFCNELSTEDRSVANFKVFPNPSNGEININIGNNLGQGSVKIVDINGREVFSAAKELQGTVSIQVQGLATGVYLLQIQGDTISQTTKIVIE